jgi:hypothetical protein
VSGKYRRGGTRFKPTWKWSGEVDDWIAARLSSFDGKAPAPVLMVPCGSSRLGHLRADKFPGDIVRPDVQADMFCLPFREGTIGTVVSDPPWNLAYDERSRLNHELARVLRDDGLLIFNAPWVPTEVLFGDQTYMLSMNRGGLDRNVSVVTEAHRRPRPLALSAADAPIQRPRSVLPSRRDLVPSLREAGVPAPPRPACRRPGEGQGEAVSEEGGRA